MDAPRHRLPEGWVLIERDIDLFGRVLVYGIEGTAYEVVRLPVGWRARLASRGRARRAYVGPGWESAPQCVRYLEKWSYIRS